MGAEAGMAFWQLVIEDARKMRVSVNGYSEITEVAGGKQE